MRPALARKNTKNLIQNTRDISLRDTRLLDLLNNNNPITAIKSGKLMAKAWVKSLSPEVAADQAHSFMYVVIETYWQEVHNLSLLELTLPLLSIRINLSALDESVLAVAEAIGKAASRLEVINASYQLGNVYTSILSDDKRSGQGIFYTPPSLTNRLLQITEEAGVDWRTAKVVDPACGGGAFLTPVALRMMQALSDQQPLDIIKHIETHLSGFEIDPFGAWLTQVFVEVSLKTIMRKADYRISSLVRVCNSLEIVAEVPNKFDLVIGNPPYGKVKLSDSIRARFKESLFGHPNYYGLFTHLATDLVKVGGVIGFLTPTSFLSGEYFKNLRLLLRKHSNPVEIDFVSFRKGVFDDVLQETMLAVYKNDGMSAGLVKVNQITTLPESELTVLKAGAYKLSKDLSAPWILPRTPLQMQPVKAMKRMQSKLKDWGYKVSTGPLVWNRHKKQLCKKSTKDCYPIIWAEAITRNGDFILRAEKKNHLPYFKFLAGDDCLLINKPCILLQRTTAKEQDKRLIAAALPAELLEQKKGVVVENHLNMILPIGESPAVTAKALAAFLNSKAVNDAFRCISGSVAVSAYELESLPLPKATVLKSLENMIIAGASQHLIEEECHRIYNG
jgi:adenine-specific DNA-methyltransferase